MHPPIHAHTHHILHTTYFTASSHLFTTHSIPTIHTATYSYTQSASLLSKSSQSSPHVLQSPLHNPLLLIRPNTTRQVIATPQNRIYYMQNKKKPTTTSITSCSTPSSLSSLPLSPHRNCKIFTLHSLSFSLTVYYSNMHSSIRAWSFLYATA